MPHVPLILSLDRAEPRIGNGWLAQFRGASWLSKVIQYGTGGPYSHSAMLQRTNGHVDLLEVREFYGGRRVPLESQVARYPGKIDVFSIDLERFPEFDGPSATKVMRCFTGRDYGYHGVSRLALQKVPLLWRCWPLDVTDDDLLDAEAVGAPFCSHAVCAAMRIGGGVDPIPNKPDHLVTPNDLSWSLLYRYEFTLTT